MQQKFTAAKAAIVHDGKILFLKKAKFEVGKALKSGLDVPGGRYSSNETPQQALKREVKEETGLDVELIKNILAFDVINNEIAHIKANAFLCRLNNPKQKITLSEEHSAYEWHDINKNHPGIDGWLIDILEKAREEVNKTD